MLGEPGRGPISEGSGLGRQLALAAALLLVLAGGYTAWFGSLPAWTFSEVATPAEVAPSPAPVAAANAPVAIARPEPRASYVVDGARLLSDEAIANLNLVLTELNTTAGPQVLVMTVPDLGGATIEDYARRIAGQWAIGDASRDDGVLLLIAPGQKRVRIEVGTGLTDRLTDADCRRIIDTAMLPLFRQGHLDRATVAGTLALIRHLRAHPTIPRQGR